MKLKKYFLIILASIILLVVPYALANEFDDGGGGGPPRYFIENDQYFSNLYGVYKETMDNMVFTETSCFDGLTDGYGHFDSIDKIYLNLQVSLNPDTDVSIDKWYHKEQSSYFIDSVKVSIKIQNPRGNYLSEDLVAGLTQYKCTGGGTQNALMVVLYTASTEFIPGALPYPLSATLKTITNTVPNPTLNKYEDGPDSTDPYKHWWKFDYGWLSGDPELGLQIIFSPTFGIYKGYYIISFEYEIKIKLAGWYMTFFDMFPQPFEEHTWTYTTQHSLIVIKDIGIDP